MMHFHLSLVSVCPLFLWYGSFVLYAAQDLRILLPRGASFFVLGFVFRIYPNSATGNLHLHVEVHPSLTAIFLAPSFPNQHSISRIVATIRIQTYRVSTMLFTTAAARLTRATITRRGFTSTSALNGVPTVHYDHFASGWNENDEPYTEGKFHIETFNKISPLVRAFDNVHVCMCILMPSSTTTLTNCRI
jgi:hypothetical protein